MCIEVYRSSRSEVLCNFIKKETEFIKFFNNTYFYRTTPVAASGIDKTF